MKDRGPNLSSNPARIHISQLTLSGSGYHEKFQRFILASFILKSIIFVFKDTKKVRNHYPFSVRTRDCLITDIVDVPPLFVEDS